MATVARSRSATTSSVPRSQAGRSLTSPPGPRLQTPQSVMVNEGLNSSKATLPPYSPANSSTVTLVEKQNPHDSPKEAPKGSDQGPPRGGPSQNPPEGPPQGPPGPPGQNLGVKILEGWALGLTVFTLCFGLFLATLESTIISTSLVTIASELGSYNKASWVVVTYLLTYTSFLVIWTRLSDIFGRKILLIAATMLFILSSIACALAQSMQQLIGFRAVQGIGGSGLYSLAYASILDVVPFRLMGPVSGAMSMASACSSVLGPVIGGAITSHASWRWVFWINVPTGAFVVAFVIFVFPKSTSKFTPSHLRQIDLPGVLLSLGGSILLIVPLEEGGATYAWSSIMIILLIVSSGVCWGAFAVWETWLTGRGPRNRMLPIFPMRLLSHRVIAATFATGFLAGFPFMVVVVNLPQRLQIVNGMSPATAGIHILPLLSQVAVGAFVTGVITSKVNIAWYLLVLSNIMTTVGVGLMSALPTTTKIPPIEYFYQVILGFGFGVTLTCLMVVVRSEVAFQDNAVATGAITQVRTLGGVIGIAVVQAVLISHVDVNLANILPPEQAASILSSTENISLLTAAAQEATRSVFGAAVNLQFRTVTGFAAAALGTSLFVYRKNKVDMHALEAQRVAAKSGQPMPSDAGNDTSKDVEAQRCCSVDSRSVYSIGRWDSESSQTWDEDEAQQWQTEREGGSTMYESRLDRGGQSANPWSLSTHPIPQGHLFHPAELSCPRCGYSILDKIR